MNMREIVPIGDKKYPATLVPIANIPTAQVIDTCRKDTKVKYSGNTISIVGAYTKTIGTINFPTPNVNAFKPVRNGLDPAIPAAA
jgi:hypothetical protein